MPRVSTRIQIPDPLVGLVLAVGLAHHETPSGLDFQEWRSILARCYPDEQLVVIYRVLYDRTYDQIADLLGAHRSWPKQVWEKAINRLSLSPQLRQLIEGN